MSSYGFLAASLASNLQLRARVCLSVPITSTAVISDRLRSGPNVMIQLDWSSASLSCINYSHADTDTGGHVRCRIQSGKRPIRSYLR